MVAISGKRSSPGNRRWPHQPVDLAGDGDGSLLDAAVALVHVGDAVEAGWSGLGEEGLDLGA
jgi:hypothetical protein